MDLNLEIEIPCCPIKSILLFDCIKISSVALKFIFEFGIVEFPKLSYSI